MHRGGWSVALLKHHLNAVAELIETAVLIVVVPFIDNLFECMA